jgi:uncharacterized protein with HEPN domain
MPLDERDCGALWDILQAGRNIREFIAEVDARQFERDKKTHFAVISQIQIIGEAAKRLSITFRDGHAGVPWQQIAGMRDVLIHNYDDVDLKRVWAVANTFVPDLIAYIEPLLPPEE